MYESVRPYGDREGVGLGESVGEVASGPLAGTWRSWPYPSSRRDGLHEIDAHVEISTAGGIVLNRHAGPATHPAGLAPEAKGDVVQYATFVSEVPALARLNRVLAVGVGAVRAPASVVVSYYELAPPA